MQLPRLAIVDLETTGADPSRDRITEIAILITEGDQLIETWTSLVNPGMPIPQRIQDLIGITDKMVAAAPPFEMLAEQVLARLSEVVFVAHNARFDYNFLRAAFDRMGLLWTAPVLCTVKFSRALDPEFPRHGLDALIERHGYTIDARHRALDDAQIVWRFLGDSLQRADDARLQKAWDKAHSIGNDMPRLPRGDLEALPDSPGAWVYRSVTGQLLDIGYARDLRSQVLGFFTNTRHSLKNKKVAAAVADVETWPCAGELGAQLKELQLLRSLRDQARTRALGWRWMRRATQAPVLVLDDLAGSDPADWQDIFGCLRGEREATIALQELSRQHKLCASRLGLERGGGPCQAVHLGRCNGVCVCREAPEIHDARLATALAALRMKPWPFPGIILVREHHAASERSETHVVDQWCLLGSAQSESALASLLESPPARRFDADIFRIISRWLAAPEHLTQVQAL